jgi:tetrahydromethanopterin S-methyltransferase subunit G
MDLKKISEFAKQVTEHCPVEARNFFEEILDKLDKIEKRLDNIENKIDE